MRYRIDGILHNKIFVPAELHAATVSRLKILAKMEYVEELLAKSKLAEGSAEQAEILKALQQKVKEGKGAFGYNAATDEYEDLMKAGIIDPTKVVRCALQNAASVAGLMITTEAIVAEKPKEEKPGAGGHGGHSHGGGMDF